MTPPDEFWTRIDRLGGSVDRARAMVLIDELQQDGPAAVRQFGCDLTLAMRLLDTPAHLERLVTDSTSGVVDMPMSDDLFAYARGAVVAAGRAEWERVLSDPTALDDDRPVFDGEWLVMAPYLAAEALGVPEDQRIVPDLDTPDCGVDPVPGS